MIDHTSDAVFQHLDGMDQNADTDMLQRPARTARHCLHGVEIERRSWRAAAQQGRSRMRVRVHQSRKDQAVQERMGLVASGERWGRVRRSNRCDSSAGDPDVHAFKDVGRIAERGNPGAGNPDLAHRTCPPLQPASPRNAHPTRRLSAATLTTMGKNEITKAVMIAGTVPIPDQITISGTTATFGIELNPINSG